MASINFFCSKHIPSSQHGSKNFNAITRMHIVGTPNLLRKSSRKARVPYISAITTSTNQTLPDNGHLDVSHLPNAFSSIPEAIADICQGKLVIVVDDENRENEGDLIMAASMITPVTTAFFVKYGTGIVCVCMKEINLKKLKLPLMVNDKENEEKLRTAFTITVDAKQGTTTGVSAQDRTATILALASKDSVAEDFIRPGHIFPLMYREGGVLRRPGHTEASVNLVELAGLDPVAVICEIVDDDDGSMARLPKLAEFAQIHNLKIISIAELIRYIKSEKR